MRKYRNYEDGLKVRLADSAYAKEYLAIALEEYDKDGNIQAFFTCPQGRRKRTRRGVKLTTLHQTQ